MSEAKVNDTVPIRQEELDKAFSSRDNWITETLIGNSDVIAESLDSLKEIIAKMPGSTPGQIAALAKLAKSKLGWSRWIFGRSDR